MGNNLLAPSNLTNEESKESDYFYEELYGSSRSDKKTSLGNIKAALDYLFDYHDPATVSYNDITEYISRSPGKDLKAKTPKTGQQIKNDAGGMKRYVDLRKLEAKVGTKVTKTQNITRSEVDELLKESKEALVDQLRLAQQLNVGYIGKIRQYEKVSNQKKIVIKNINPSTRIAQKNANNSELPDEPEGRLMNSEKDILIQFYMDIVDENGGVSFRKDGVFLDSKKIGDSKVIDVIAKSIGMDAVKFISRME